MTEGKLHEAHFLQLVMSLQSSAWVTLGKVMNPMTGKIERNLDASRSVIDTLLMIQSKTKGNLNRAEEDFLGTAIQQLQANYFEEVAKGEVKQEGSKDGDAALSGSDSSKGHEDNKKTEVDSDADAQRSHEPKKD